MSNRPDRPDQPKRRPSKPGSSKSGSSRRSSSSSRSRASSSASMSRGPRPIVAGSDRSGDMSGSNRSGANTSSVGARRREQQKKKDKNKPIIIGATIFVVLAIGVVFVSFTIGNFSSDDEKPGQGNGTGQAGTNPNETGKVEFDPRDPYPDMLFDGTYKDGIVLEKFMSMEAVQRKIGAPNSTYTSRKNDGTINHVYGRGSLMNDRIDGFLLVYNQYKQLIMVLDQRKAR